MTLKPASPQDTYSLVFGASPMSFGWWLGTKTTGVDHAAWEISDNWQVEVTCEDGNDGKVTKIVDHAVIMEAARKVMADRPKYSSDALVEGCTRLTFDADSCDFDACSADELLQFILLGEVVFG